MVHPIHQANPNSLFGDLTREEFYKEHGILHHENYMLNKKNRNIFTQSWRPDSPSRFKGLVAMIHGYSTESSSLIQLTAVAIAKLGFFVCALDLQGHGYSEGTRGHIPNINPIMDDCIQFFDSVRLAHSDLPAFIYGESLGGAIALLICLSQTTEWSGLVLSGAMCGVSDKFLPAKPLLRLLPLAAFFLPTWRAVLVRPLADQSFKEKWKRELLVKSPNSPTSSKPTSATALELLRVCEEVKRRSPELETPLLIVHGEDDIVCDANSARRVFEMARSKDKTLEILPGMWHQLVGEKEEGVELAFKIIFDWILDRAAKACTSTNGNNVMSIKD
ncbi:hypothetical protein MRB53_024702 [Persea americana]|uniref:Uncharacterized protein n=1 Tax=Persea americana TaxID=3435 RepID=A0ACC2LEB8_PERAE|nr:hypothetical protein MRB53_024702 [Persea americana]